MILKKSNPTTSSQRHFIQLNKNFLAKTPLIKSKLIGLKNSSGRNNSGKITSYHRGKGHKKRYRKINFSSQQETIGIITSIEYDPNRTANISSVYNIKTNKYFYILNPIYLKIGNIVKTGLIAEPRLGHSLSIEKIPAGSFIYNISSKFKQKNSISRAAGTYSYLIEKTNKNARIKLSSGEQILISTKCYATIGIVSNQELFLTSLGKAGRARWLNKRPKVRGVAMNPIDHPHGGGEGKTSGGRTSVTPWGKPTKNRSTSRTNNFLIVRSRKKNE